MTLFRIPMMFALAAGALAWTAAARAEDAPKLTFVHADSEETAGEDGKGANAFDGNPDTLWHTQWQDNTPAHPHEIVFDLDPPAKIKGITYLPRQGDTENGTIKDYEIYTSENGTDFSLAKKGTFDRGHDKQAAVFDLKTVKRVKLIALSEINGEAWASAAEIGIVREGDKIAVKPGLHVVKVDSEETAGEDGKGANATDGNNETFWHTQWQDATPGCPHEITLQLEPAAKIKGLTYLPRQDSDHGRIKDYEVYVSDDGKEFGQPVAKGTWENNEQLKTISFDAKQAAFIKLKALSEVNGEAWTSAAEIKTVPDAP